MATTQVKVYDPLAEQALLGALKKRGRGDTALMRLTKADAVALTGLPMEQAEPALKSLVKTYRSHLAVTEEGELVYEFDPALERRDQVTLRERLAALGALAWRGFTFLFKIWIMVTLIVYVVAFVLMLLSLMFARSASSSDDRDDRRDGGGFDFPWIWFWLMPDWGPTPMDRYGRPMRRRSGGPQKRFYQSVFDYVFGPKLPPADPRLMDRQIIAYLRDHRGRITASDVVALTGLSFTDAEEELTRLMVEYDGEAEVADDGTLVYNFRDILVSAQAPGDALASTSWRYAWDQPEPSPKLTGNSTGANTLVTVFAAFNLIASLTVGPLFLLRFGLSADPTASFFVTSFPLMFSALFFAVPGGRWLVERRRSKRRERRNLRRAIVREIWAQPGSPLNPDDIATRIAKQLQLTPAVVRAELDRMVADLDGDVTTDADGHMRYVFPRIAEERLAIEKARAEGGEIPKLGQVVFSSEDERIN